MHAIDEVNTTLVSISASREGLTRVKLCLSLTHVNLV